MSIAIMQPYFAPYLGYFQLINEVDTFIFYDDVNFIKGGWINRNYITINDKLSRFTIPLKKSSSFKKINETEVNWECKDMTKLIKTFNIVFKKNPISMGILNTIFYEKPKTISDMSIMSIELFSKELGIKTKFKKSSELNYEKQGDKLLNLIEICKKEKSNHYINPEGGQNLYKKEDFERYGVKLNFIKGINTPSIIDIIGDPDVKNKINNYTII
jgi:hypothetical protein